MDLFEAAKTIPTRTTAEVYGITAGRTNSRAGGCSGDQQAGDPKAQPARSLYDRAL
ncbi:MAG: hypothetical protein HUJ72_09615 [Blautia sp.]|nr:hypothetical protein [Blautia sp.]